LVKRIIRQVSQAMATPSVHPGEALRQMWRSGYGWSQLRDDLMAGAVVGVVALPLSMALAIASGVPPQHGLYTAIIAGFLIALAGGSKVQVSGPTAAFVIILAPIAMKFGVGGLLLAGLMAGLILLFMGLCRFGRLIQFIPYPVTTGFTAGIALVIATMQIRDLLGLPIAHLPDHYVERVVAMAAALPGMKWQELAIGAMTLAILIYWPRISRKAPGPLVALTAAALAAVALSGLGEGYAVDTLATRFSYEMEGQTHAGIPRMPPTFAWPWTWGGPGGEPLTLNIAFVRDLLPSALTIAMLGAIESLLSAVVADGMTGSAHDPDCELLAQGLGNLAAPLFGGIAATGAIARTATNIRHGARSPVAAMFHAIVVLAAMVALAPWLGYLPMSAMAALLLRVAWNMAEVRHVVHAVRISPHSDVLVLLVCFTLTVIFDMVVAVLVGTILAALLFMRRMAEVADVRLISERHHGFDGLIPPGVALYEVAGPMFFGATHKAMSALSKLDPAVRVIVLDLASVPVMDATALVNLESAVDRLTASRVHVVLGGVQKQPLDLLARSHMRKSRENLKVRRHMPDALALAAALAATHA